MSYTRTYHESVSESGTVSASYPASEHGGSLSVPYHVQIPVNIQVAVDTRPMDSSVGQCSRKMSALAGAIAATETAHVAAIGANARRVSDTVVKGFFGLIRSELTQQISECRARCEALLLKLNDMKAACLGKKSQMEKDFARIASRYTTLFEDLDRELANRVRALDRAAFVVEAAAAGEIRRPTSTSISTAPAVLAGEEGDARARLALNVLRSSALALLQRASAYVVADRQLGRSLRAIVTADRPEAVLDKHIPVLLVAADGLGGDQAEERLVADTGKFAALRPTGVQNQLRERFRDNARKWVPMDGDTRGRIDTFLKNQAGAIPSEPGSVEARVGAMTMELWRNDRPAIPSPAAAGTTQKGMKA
jgi:hypothetical protein